MKKKYKKIALLLLLVSTTFVAFKPSEKYFDIAKNLDIFATLYREVNSYYVDEVDPTDLMNKAIKSMLSSLDPYTSYIPEDRIEDYRTMIDGKYSGIGAVIGVRNKKVLVLMPKEGFAAHKAGLQIGDEILSIDGTNVKGKTVGEVSKLLKGSSGSEVNVMISRYGEKDELNVPIVRESIQLKNVPYYGMVNDKIGYIKLTDFTRDASKEVKEALKSLKNDGATSVMLDLRGNPGGLLREAIRISNIFIPKGGEVVSTKGKVKEWNKKYFATEMPLDTQIPVAVLVNGSSASASEIVSGVLQDMDRAVLVGRNTYGKGLVQSTRSLSYNSKLKVTVAKYYIPSGRCIQRIDYSHRNKKGKALDVPDSLRKEFLTKSGRKVYDGGGVKPDIVIKKNGYAPITKALSTNNLIFEYAAKYHFEHEKIVDPKEFMISDQEYKDFVMWVKKKNVNYDTKLQKSLNDLELVAKNDPYYKEIKLPIENLKKEVAENKNSDLLKFNKELKEILSYEICKFYGLEKASLENSFQNDQDVLSAIEILSDTEKYNTILKK